MDYQGNIKLLQENFAIKTELYTEWKNGISEIYYRRRKGIFRCKNKAALEVEFVEIFNEFEKNINLDVF